ncbi:MAG: hypothetical protein ACHQ0Y_05045 [Thermodesulfovibrionales bacterium]
MEKSEYWEDLPEGTFKDQGTMVNVALVVLGYEEVQEKLLTKNEEEVAAPTLF